MFQHPRTPRPRLVIDLAHCPTFLDENRSHQDHPLGEDESVRMVGLWCGTRPLRGHGAVQNEFNFGVCRRRSIAAKLVVTLQERRYSGEWASSQLLKDQDFSTFQYKRIKNWLHYNNVESLIAYQFYFSTVTIDIYLLLNYTI